MKKTKFLPNLEDLKWSVINWILPLHIDKAKILTKFGGLKVISYQLHLASTHSILLFPVQKNEQKVQKCNKIFNTKGKP